MGQPSEPKVYYLALHSKFASPGPWQVTSKSWKWKPGALPAPGTARAKTAVGGASGRAGPSFLPRCPPQLPSFSPSQTLRIRFPAAGPLQPRLLLWRPASLSSLLVSILSNLSHPGHPVFSDWGASDKLPVTCSFLLREREKDVFLGIPGNPS